MGVQHDANHSAYSSRPWVNRLFSCTLDLMGVSSFIWRQKHNVIHHSFTNINGIDGDIEFGPIARLTWRHNAAASWFLGGLSVQIEHHLFPKVCHLNYPALSRIIDEVAAKHHLRVRRRATVRDGIAAHYRHVRRLGLRTGERLPTQAAPLVEGEAA